jgi:5-carboxymethyl-2-hydroxymuconate isomerase
LILPHFNIEYSANLDERIDMPKLCQTIHAAILKTGLFELGAVRVRAFAAYNYAITDMLPENAFIDMIFRVGQGRSAEALKQAGDAIFQAASDELKSLLATPHFALSLEIQEINADLSWKKNSMHARLRQTL